MQHMVDTPTSGGNAKSRDGSTQLVPDGPMSGLQFMTYSWRILKARASLLIPASLALSAVAASINVLFTVRSAGGVQKAADSNFDLATILMTLVQNPAAAARSSALVTVTALLMTSLIIPSIANSAIVAVIDDAIASRRSVTSHYARLAARRIGPVIAAQVAGSIAAVGPIAVFYVFLITAGKMTPIVATALEVLVGLPLSFAAVYLTIGWLFSPQFVILRHCNPIQALRQSAALARRHRLRITTIFIMTALLSSSIAMLIATPIAWLGTLNGSTAAGPTLGSQLATAFITTWAQQTVTIVAMASVLTLLFVDLHRRRTAL